MFRQACVPALVCALAAAPVSADCVGPADLDLGVRVDYADGTWAELRRAGDDLLRLTESPDPASGTSRALILRHGLYETEAIEDAAAPDRIVRTAWSGANGTEPPMPEPGTSWLALAEVTRPDGSELRVDAAFTFGMLEKVTLNGCPYERVNVKASFLGGDGWMWQEFVYFPALGFAVVMGNQTSADTSPRRFTLAGIRRADS